MIAIPKFARHFLERLSRGRTLRKRLPHRFGSRPLYVSPDAPLRFLYPGERGFDPMLLSLAEQWVQPRTAIWDIGANVGVFAFAAAHKTCGTKVVAVEPAPILASLSRRACRMRTNTDLDIEVISAALSDRVGVTKLEIAERGRCSNSIEGALASSQAGGIRDRITVPTLTLDTMLNDYPPPSLVKIDVEGAESAVFKGGERLLSTIRPVIFVEVCSENSDFISERLLTNGYSLYEGGAKMKDLRRIDKCTFNTLALPQERKTLGR
jgi:FkbM family methyltransferase